MKRRLSAIRSLLPGRERLLGWLPYAAVGLALSGVLTLASLVLVPAWRGVEAQQAALAAALQAYEERRLSLELMERTVREELTAASDAATEFEALLLSRQDAAEILNRLYAQAEAAGVQVVDLRGQPSPQEGTGAPYQVRVLRLRVSGGVPSLLNLVSLIQRTAPAGAFLLEALRVEQAPEGATLTVDLVLYVAQGQDDPADATPAPPVPGPAEGAPEPAPEEDRPPEPPAPPAEPTPVVLGPCTHRVAPGETLYSLARRYRTSVMTLKTLNGLTGDTIYVGQTLRIPAPSS